MMNITARIEKLRKEKGWSVAKLAREAEIPTVSLRVMLNRTNVNNYGVDALIKIAEALGTTVSFLTAENDMDDRPVLTKIDHDRLMMKFEQILDEMFNQK